MSQIFICYSRQSQDIVKTLANDIEELSHNVWFDQELTGGQVWWDQILERIRECDIFVFALAPKALDSPACKLELKYASDLCKTILPVLVSDGVSDDLLPLALSTIHYVDYRDQGKQTVLALNKAINNLPVPQPLPEPLPDSPDAPISYLGNLKDKIETTKTLSFQEQTALVLKLKDGLREIDDVNIVCDLLQRLRKRKGLFANVAEEIDDILASIPKSLTGGVMSSKNEPWRKRLEWPLLILVSIIIVIAVFTIIRKRQEQQMVKISPNVTDKKAGNINSLHVSMWTIQIISYSNAREHLKKATNLAKDIKNMTGYNTFVAKREDELVVCVGKFNFKDSNEMKKALEEIRELEYEGETQFTSSYPIQIR